MRSPLSCRIFHLRKMLRLWIISPNKVPRPENPKREEGDNTITCLALGTPAPTARFIPPTAQSLTLQNDGSRPQSVNRRRRRKIVKTDSEYSMTEPRVQCSDSEHDFGGQPSLLQVLCPSQALNGVSSLTVSHPILDITSCLPRHTNEATLDDKDQASLLDMLCNAKATVVTVPTVDETDSEWSLERDNCVLRNYFRVRTNIVLDSQCPERVPHIVVTPAQETSESFYVPWYNRVDYQFHDTSLLTAPSFDARRLSMMPDRSVESYWPVPAKGLSIQRGIPSRVFSPSLFNHRVHRSEVDRVNMNDVVTALQRHLLKAIAFEASDLAIVWQKRYEDVDVFQSIENEFVWTDPAEPILKCANWPGVVVFESHNPFAVPHIMLCTEPQQDPWIAHSNAVNDPQDVGFGRYLVVPSRIVNFINVHNTRYDDDEYDDTFDNLDVSDADSPPDTPEPSTPVDLEDDLDYYSPATRWQLDSEQDDQTEHSLIYETPPDKWTYEPRTTKTEMPPRPSRPIFYVEDEEEDDLPPLDDWYLSVASRNGLQIAS
ncbi:hypothetical protein FA15DRAFT_706429 [Coprinopsis marcescibilis]|uniref:Uncharacterized protein n=1 Tax=Coprinopsis marcescibilis TaxID=230819 RepID=A0A5C3KP66_COPMA|nr:hypothetical protein FA15DRAFT_706429 [Coprinopsis marcescibilis]